MDIQTYAWKKTLAGAILDETFDKITKHEWSLVGYEIKFPSAYTGTISFIKVVSDTDNESNRTYTTPTKTAITNDAIFDPTGPIFIASAGDTLNIKTSAVITGDVEIKVYCDVSPQGAGGRLT